MIRGVDISIEVFHEKQLSIADSYSLLQTLPVLAGLTPLGPPIVYSFPSPQCPEEDGLTGTSVMVESHVAFHWWPNEKYTHITISSCKPVATDPCYDYIKKLFETQKVKLDITWWEGWWNFGDDI